MCYSDTVLSARHGALEWHDRNPPFVYRFLFVQRASIQHGGRGAAVAARGYQREDTKNIIVDREKLLTLSSYTILGALGQDKRVEAFQRNLLHCHSLALRIYTGGAQL